MLGLGSQVKPHIERRFSMPWSHPAPRMRELVLAMRAIWRTWQEGEPLDFRGDFYTHTLMTPFFSPPPHEWGPPPVYVAGVGERMTETAGEVGDGFFFHPFTTDRYLREVTLPALRRGRAAAGRTGLEGFEIAGPAFTCTGRDDRELAAAIKGTKDQIAFYASTPAYRPVLELHGWGDLQPELTALSKQGRWSEMGDAVDDELLHAFAVVGEPAEVGRGLRRRWGDVATRLTLYATYAADPAVWPDVIDASATAATHRHGIDAPERPARRARVAACFGGGGAFGVGLRHGCRPGTDRGRHPRELGADARHLGGGVDRGRVGGRDRRGRDPGVVARRAAGGHVPRHRHHPSTVRRGPRRTRQHGRHPPPGVLPDDPDGLRSRPRRPRRRLVVAAACRRAAPHRRTSVHRCRHRHHDVRRSGGTGGPPRRGRPDGRSRARPARRGVGADDRPRADALADDGRAGPVHPSQPRRRRAGGHTPDRRARHGDRRAHLPGGVRAREALRRAVPDPTPATGARASPAEEERCSN